MSIELQVRTTILPGGRIEIEAPELPEGQSATVRITVGERAERPKRRLSDIVNSYQGAYSFRTAEEVDRYLKEERDSWDD